MMKWKEHKGGRKKLDGWGGVGGRERGSQFCFSCTITGEGVLKGVKQ